ncbi:MAG: hypothetical protein DRN88_01685 [Candidatus Hydrothermarchaeota archaeon]|nr:MAG: hypothetical protein DRN88_01685 [Candidatus Hydrothermarchaeota archaeon]
MRGIVKSSSFHSEHKTDGKGEGERSGKILFLNSGKAGKRSPIPETKKEGDASQDELQRRIRNQGRFYG